MVTPNHFLALAAVLFAIGAAGVVIRRNVIVIFMCIELMLNAANLTFVAASNALGNMDGQTAVMFVMTVAAGEAAVGLAVILSMYRTRQSLDVDDMVTLRW